MGDVIGLGSVTDCRLRSFSNHRRHTQQCRAAPQQKSKQTQPEPMSSPINYPAYSSLNYFLPANLFFDRTARVLPCCHFERNVITKLNFQYSSRFLRQPYWMFKQNQVGLRYCLLCYLDYTTAIMVVAEIRLMLRRQDNCGLPFFNDNLLSKLIRST